MKMRALSGKGKVGLEEHIQYIKDYRIRAQSMVQPEDFKDESIRGKKSDWDSSSKSTLALLKSLRLKMLLYFSMTHKLLKFDVYELA